MSLPTTITTKLPNDLTATTTVTSQNGLQVANVEFTVPVCGLLCAYMLNPMQPQVSNQEKNCSAHKLTINRLTFTAGFAMGPGQVTCDAVITDDKGQNPVPFNMTIATWTV